MYVSKQKCYIWSYDDSQDIVKDPLHSQEVTVWHALLVKGHNCSIFLENEPKQGERYRVMINDFFVPH